MNRNLFMKDDAIQYFLIRSKVWKKPNQQKGLKLIIMIIC